MSAPARSHNVCGGCRQRKRRCNGRRPACEGCIKRGDLCMYDRAQELGGLDTSGWTPAFLSGDISEPWYPWPSNDMNQMFGFEASPDFASMIPASNGKDNDWMLSSKSLPVSNPMESSSPETYNLPTPDGSTSTPNPPLLPPLDHIVELVDLFFEKFYRYLPVIHRLTLMSKVQTGGLDDVSSVLLFSIIAVSAGAHPNRQIQQAQTGWFEEAKAQLSKAMHSRDHSLQTLQAANLVIFQAIILLDFSTSWIVLGEAWRKAVAIGVAQGDGASHMTMPALGERPSESLAEREEGRRVIWMLFILDRGMCFPLGMMHCIDDRQLRVNFPMADEGFQVPDPSLDQQTIQYTRSLDKLITAVQQQQRQGSATMFQYIILAYTLLGQVSEQIYSLDFDYDEQAPILSNLTLNLVRIRLILPRSVTELSAADHDDFAHVIWLSAVMSVSTILLHHRPLRDGEAVDSASDMAKNWPHCVAAARSTVAVLRDASRASVDFVANAHLASLIFMCSRILVIEYICPTTSRTKASGPTNAETPNGCTTSNRNPALRSDLEILALTFKRMREALNGLGAKFCRGMGFYLRQGEEHALLSKLNGAGDLLKTCDKWVTIADDDDITIPS